jgi:hypothetical protein
MDIELVKRFLKAVLSFLLPSASFGRPSLWCESQLCRSYAGSSSLRAMKFRQGIKQTMHVTLQKK